MNLNFMLRDEDRWFVLLWLSRSSSEARISSPRPAACAKTKVLRTDDSRADPLTRSSSFAEAKPEDRTRNERRSERKAGPWRTRLISALTARDAVQRRHTGNLNRCNAGAPDLRQMQSVSVTDKHSQVMINTCGTCDRAGINAIKSCGRCNRTESVQSMLEIKTRLIKRLKRPKVQRWTDPKIT